MHEQGDSSGVHYYKFSEYGHYRNECPHENNEKKSVHNGVKPRWETNGHGEGRNAGKWGRGGSAAGRGRGGGATRCSPHNRASHSDKSCLK